MNEILQNNTIQAPENKIDGEKKEKGFLKFLENKTLVYGILGFIGVCVIALAFYYFFYKKLPKVQEGDLFEQTEISFEEQTEIVRGLKEATEPMTPEQRSLAIENFLGANTQN